LLLEVPLLLLAVVVAAAILQPAYADPMSNVQSRQRIGNYDFELTTEPAPLVSDAPAKVLLRIASVNGDDLVDVPLTLRLVRDGQEIHKLGPVIVPFGHYAYERTFAEPGRYVLYADLTDYAYSGQTLTFTFVLNVAGPYDSLYVLVPGVGAAGAAAAGAIVLMKRRKAKA
jgi:hypothetical protein